MVSHRMFCFQAFIFAIKLFEKETAGMIAAVTSVILSVALAELVQLQSSHPILSVIRLPGDWLTTSEREIDGREQKGCVVGLSSRKTIEEQHWSSIEK